MKQFILALFLIFLFTACEKEIQPINDTVMSGKKTQPTNNFTSQHESIAEVFSTMTNNPQFRNLVIDEINSSTTKDNHSVSFLEILQGNNANTFANVFNTAVAATPLALNVNLNYFINTYLKQHPNLCISIFYPNPPNTDLGYINNQLPVFSEIVYDNSNNPNIYEFFRNGAKDPSLTQSSRPEMIVLVLQEREGFISLDKDLITDETYFNKYSKVQHCQNIIDNTAWSGLSFSSIEEAPSISVGGTNYQNPFHNRYYITDEVITTLYNTSCDNPPVPPAGPPPPIDVLCNDGQPAERTTFNNTENEEFSHSLRIPTGNDLLELNKDWCAWWNRYCRFQVDLFYPTSFSSETFIYKQTTKYASYDEDDLKDQDFVEPAGELVFHQWYYESGNHGNEWQYMWTGKHRRGGDEETIGVNAKLAPSAEFKLLDLAGIKIKVMEANLNYGLKVTHRDLHVGDDIVFWCDEILINSGRGHKYSTGDIQFFIREQE